MRILVYGAGVLGSLAAARLQQSGQDVRLLARGPRLDDLRRHGIRLENALTGQRENVSVPLVDRLAPDQAYDLVVVVMGAHQTAAVLPTLAENRYTPNVLFVGNNAAGPGEYTAELGPARVLLGFLSNGGTIRDGVVCHGDGGRRRTRWVFGEAAGGDSSRLERLGELFEAAGFAPEPSPDIDSWLKTHAALIVPLAGAVYMAGGTPASLAEDRAALRCLIPAWREALRALRRNGVAILPGAAHIYERVPGVLAVPLLRRFLRTPQVQLAFAHAEHARPEMHLLAEQLAALARQAGVPTPALDRLSAAIRGEAV